MLGIWMYQWDTAAWVTGTPAPAPAPVPAPSSGGSGGRKKRKPYTPADDHFWQVRERYLRRFLPMEPIASPTPIVEINLPVNDVADTLVAPAAGGGPDILLLQALHAAQQRAATANNAAELRDATMRSRKLLLDISKIRQQHYSRAIALLLFDPL